jgi:hypothetical protein
MGAALLALSLFLSQVPPVVLPCVPGDSTVVCKCKQGTPAACAELAKVNPELLKGILRMAAMAQAAQESGGADSKEKAADAVDTGCGSGQDPNNDDAKQKCTGQWHHIISMTVWLALERNPALRGHYTYRDPRFVKQAKDLKAHCGYESWHRRVDKEIAKWLDERPNLTLEQFEAYLREVYSRAELLARFPNGF